MTSHIELFSIHQIPNKMSTEIKKVLVTGGSGKAGRAVVKELVAHGYDVVNVDIAPPKEDLGVPFVKVDLNKFDEVLAVLKGQDAVVHLAAIPAPGIKSEEETFSNNIITTFNVFQVRIKVFVSMSAKDQLTAVYY